MNARLLRNAWLILVALAPGLRLDAQLPPPGTDICAFGPAVRPSTDARARREAERTQVLQPATGAGAWGAYNPADAEGGTPAGPPSTTAVRGVEWIEQDRGAVYNQPGEHIHVRVRWNSPTPITGMRISFGTSRFAALHDDGTHGDAVAHDGIWTTDSLSIYSPTGTPAYKVAKDAKYASATNRWFPIQWQREDGSWENDGYAYVRVGFVDPLYTVDAELVGPGIWATEHCLFIEDSVQTERIFPGYPVTDKTWSYLLGPAVRLLLAHKTDAFDFVVVTPATAVWLPNPVLLERVPNATTTRNTVQGIGLPVFDNTATWGSSGKLQAVIYHSCGPFTMLAHELGHRWMAYLDSLTFSNGYCGVHWAEHQTIGGAMSLWPKVIETSPGVYKGVLSHTPDAFNASFSELDLYLMGLQALSQVPMIKRLNGPDYANPDTARYDSITLTDPSALPSRYGARQPAYPASQRDFTMGTVVVKPLGWTDAEFAYFSILARHAADTLDDGYGYNYNFEKAARRLATLDSRMGAPVGAPGTPVLTFPADGATGLSPSVALGWDSSAGATRYEVQLSRRSDFTDSVSQKAGLTGLGHTFSALMSGATYYWRVRAVGPSGVSRYAAPRSFTTSGATSIGREGESAAKEYALYGNYPNPFNPTTTIAYAVPVDAFVTLRVFTPLGQEVRTLVNAVMPAGRHTALFDGSGLSSGVYFVRLTAVPRLSYGREVFTQVSRLVLSR